MPTLADLIRTERQRRGWTSAQLGAAAGLAGATIDLIEQGRRFTELDGLYGLALAFADGDRAQAGIWLHQFITAMGYPLSAPAD